MELLFDMDLEATSISVDGMSGAGEAPPPVRGRFYYC